MSNDRMKYTESQFQKLPVDSLDDYQLGAGMVLVEREQQEEKSHGIFLVRKGDEERTFEHSYARVIKLGSLDIHPKSGVEIQFEVAVGERVVISRFAGHDHVINTGRKYVQLAESDILCALSEAA